MHLIESYATSCGLKIDKPYCSSKFFPLNIDKYVTFHPFTKEAKNYDYWQEVVNLLLPILGKQGISILQIGGKDDKRVIGCGHLSGQTNIGQTHYIIENGLLHFGADSFPTHMASGLDKKIVSLYSSNHLNCSKPYWGNPEDQVLFEADRKGKKPSFSFNENPKSINTIAPEKIAAAICNLLDLPFDNPYQTIYPSEIKNSRMIESVPNFVVNIANLGTDSIIVRMDYFFSEENLIQQLQVCPCSIVTNKPINEQIILNFKNKIKELVYVIEEDNDPNFVDLIQRQNIPYMLISYLNEDEISAHKMKYFDFNGVINHRPKRGFKDFDNLKDKDPSRIYYKSCKTLLSDGKVFTCKQEFLNNNPVDNFDEVLPIQDTEEFWKEAECFTFLEKNHDSSEN